VYVCVWGGEGRRGCAKTSVDHMHAFPFWICIVRMSVLFAQMSPFFSRTWCTNTNRQLATKTLNSMGNLNSLFVSPLDALRGSLLVPQPQHSPEPVSVHITHMLPRTKEIPGYVCDNQFTLEYTLVQGRNTVGDLLSMMSRYGEPKGCGIMGLRRLQVHEGPHTVSHNRNYSDATSRSPAPAPAPAPAPPQPLPLDTPLCDGDRLGLVVVE
jgi:hypothetical protein